MEKFKLNLEVFLQKGSKVLSGREYGEEKRKVSRIDSIEKENDTIIITVPSYIYSINTSFFLGFFGPSVKMYGKEGFFNKYEFHCSKFTRSKLDLDADRALKESDVLRKD